jgi:prevent-host-death family protein
MRQSRVGIRDAKMHLSRYLKLVQKGEAVIITDHGRPVGKIVPISADELNLKDRIERLVEQGILEAPGGRGLKAMPPPIPVPIGAAQRMLREDRDA